MARVSGTAMAVGVTKRLTRSAIYTVGWMLALVFLGEPLSVALLTGLLVFAMGAVEVSRRIVGAMVAVLAAWALLHLAFSFPTPRGVVALVGDGVGVMADQIEADRVQGQTEDETSR